MIQSTLNDKSTFLNYLNPPRAAVFVTKLRT